jgi:hypothetical protein
VLRESNRITLQFVEEREKAFSARIAAETNEQEFCLAQSDLDDLQSGPNAVPNDSRTQALKKKQESAQRLLETQRSQANEAAAAAIKLYQESLAQAKKNPVSKPPAPLYTCSLGTGFVGTFEEVCCCLKFYVDVEALQGNAVSLVRNQDGIALPYADVRRLTPTRRGSLPSEAVVSRQPPRRTSPPSPPPPTPETRPACSSSSDSAPQRADAPPLQLFLLPLRKPSILNRTERVNGFAWGLNVSGIVHRWPACLFRLLVHVIRGSC